MEKVGLSEFFLEMLRIILNNICLQRRKILFFFIESWIKDLLISLQKQKDILFVIN